MWRNYLTVGFRALAKNKTYAFINLFGLAFGMASCLMLLLYVRFETSFDSWVPDADRIYQLQSVNTDPDTGEVSKEQTTAWPAGEALAKDFPQIELKTSLHLGKTSALRGGEALLIEAQAADENFFRVFKLPFLHGNPETALQSPQSLVLTRSEAIKLFGRTDIVGQTLTVFKDDEKTELRVAAVIEDLPGNTHLKLSFIRGFKIGEREASNWNFINRYTYVKLRPGTDVAAIHSQLPAWEKRNVPTETAGGAKGGQGFRKDWYLTKLPDIHLGEAQDSDMSPGNDRTTIVTFAAVAVLILAMACVNFVNLTTARGGQRAREVALRKTLGATRRNLIVQFIGESVLLSAIAMLIALGIVELSLPALRWWLESELTLSYFGQDGILIPVIGLALLVGAVSGIYPALYLSGLQPARTLKANRSTTDTAGSGRLRQFLVIAQFAVSIGLIICTIVVHAQSVYARSGDPGYRREGLLQVSGFQRSLVEPFRNTLKREIERVEGVQSASLTAGTIGTGNVYGTGVLLPGKSESVSIEMYPIDPAFVSTMQMRLLAGRALSETRPADVATLPEDNSDAAADAYIKRGINILINEEAVRLFGFQSPQAAIGKQVRLTIVSTDAGALPATVVGVVANPRFRSIKDPIEPTFFQYDTTYFRNLMVRYEGDPAAVRERIEQVWKRVVPEVPFEAEFADDLVAKLYRAEEKRAQTFAGFALLAVIVACMGLFGLASFTAERRTKEIGIRKVFGARIRDIVRLLTWQFSKPVILANIIAWPAAWWVMREWLNGFDARIDLGPAPFVLAGTIALAIAVATIAGHAIKVARANPIHALRYE